MKPEQLPKLYLITDRKQCQDIVSTVEQALESGLKMLQLREKDLDSYELYSLALEFRQLTADYNAKLIINDRVDIALSVGADGIHIGKRSLSISIVRKLTRGKKFLVGYSAHSLDEAIEARDEGADWITFSPIYNSASKEQYGQPQGTNELRKVAQELKIPVYALGGIKLNNIDEVINTGAFGIALISEIIASDKPKTMTANILSKLY